MEILIYILINLTVFIHIATILFVTFGVWFYDKSILLKYTHIYIFVCEVIIEINLSIHCPLTLIENYLYSSLALPIYSDGFILQYFVPGFMANIISPYLNIISIAIAFFSNLFLYYYLYIYKKKHSPLYITKSYP